MFLSYLSLLVERQRMRDYYLKVIDFLEATVDGKGLCLSKAADQALSSNQLEAPIFSVAVLGPARRGKSLMMSAFAAFLLGSLSPERRLSLLGNADSSALTVPKFATSDRCVCVVFLVLLACIAFLHWRGRAHTA